MVFTDGSFCDQKLGFSFVIYKEANCVLPLFEYIALLTPRKTILDAEATALVCSLDAALARPHRGRIFLISDCRATLRILQTGPAPGPLSYLMSPMKRLCESHHTILAAWIKGHSGHPGNDRADTLAKTPSVASNPFPGTSHSYMALHLSTATSTEWLAWFSRVPHHHPRPSRRSIKYHRHLTRVESSVLFRLHSNKSRSPGDNVSTTPPPRPAHVTSPPPTTACTLPSAQRPPSSALLIWTNGFTKTHDVARFCIGHPTTDTLASPFAPHRFAGYPSPTPVTLF